jgi:hypothetical protein
MRLRNNVLACVVIGLAVRSGSVAAQDARTYAWVSSSQRVRTLRSRNLGHPRDSWADGRRGRCHSHLQPRRHRAPGTPSLDSTRGPQYRRQQQCAALPRSVRLSCFNRPARHVLTAWANLACQPEPGRQADHADNDVCCVIRSRGLSRSRQQRLIERVLTPDGTSCTCR